MSVLYNFIGSDHPSLRFTYTSETHMTPQTQQASRCRKSINWVKMKRTSMESYSTMTNLLLSRIKVDADLIRCTDINCKNPNHRIALESLYNGIISALNHTSESCLTSCSHETFDQVPGWNDHVSDLHKIARETFLLWRYNGTPRVGPIFDSMKILRARFKWALYRQ